MAHAPFITRIEFHGFVHSEFKTLSQGLRTDLLHLAGRHPFTFSEHSATVFDSHLRRCCFLRVYHYHDSTVLVEVRRLLLEKYSWEGELDIIELTQHDTLGKPLVSEELKRQEPISY
ncbi:hypothetical protein IT401_00130 [Candidatus Nomurabacteria bacterium]|nr:hypothetical protein [Candidatus Nomurabacteria bacterium]